MDNTVEVTSVGQEQRQHGIGYTMCVLFKQFLKSLVSLCDPCASWGAVRLAVVQRFTQVDPLNLRLINGAGEFTAAISVAQGISRTGAKAATNG